MKFHLEKEVQCDPETGEEIGHTLFWLYCDEQVSAEAFWLTEEDTDLSMRSLGLLPLEERFPGFIRGYAEIGEALYVVAHA